LKGIRHLLYDQGFTIKGVQRILKDQGIRYVVGIGEGRAMEPLASAPADNEPSSQAPPAPRIAQQPEAGYDDEPGPPRLPSGGGKALSEKDREKLAEVLRELLDCKRILERAREG